MGLGVEIATRTWPEVEPGLTLLVPLGSVEQHGPHLPLDTDVRIAVAVATETAEISDAVVAPELPYGASGEHAAFAGTLSIGVEGLKVVLIELVRSAASSFDRVIFVNGHGGNHTAVTAAVEQLRREGHAVAAWSPSIPGGDAHAGRTETSLLLAISPEVVRLDQAVAGNTEPLRDLMPEMRRSGVAGVSSNGVLGDPAGASAEEGRTLLSQLTADLADLVRSGET